MTETDAQWHSLAVRNRSRRDERRKKREGDPAFRAMEAAHASDYRARKSRGGAVFEAIRCSSCERYWHRVPIVGNKPKTCPTCRGRSARSARALRQKRITAGVCVRCEDPLDRPGTQCQACVDYHAWQRRERKREG